MGNRGGAIHNDDRRIVRQYASRRWITCLLEFRGRRRTVMSPGRYTELFFLDEAVALAAGHRPCAECRRLRYNTFKAAWVRSHNLREGTFFSAEMMDMELHRARIDHAKAKVTWRAALRSLPDGCFVQMENGSWLVWEDALFRWSPERYVEKVTRARDVMVTVLTPLPGVRCIANGYKPEIHGSARQL